MTIREDAAALQGDIVRLRRNLHADPEVGLILPRTQEKVLTALDGLPLEISTGTGLSSITAVLRGGRPGPTVLLRGDMDALPMAEQTGLDFASRVEDATHACGHDLHTSMLVGAAHVLSARSDDLLGDVVFMFQPGEELCNGAGAMIEEGVLEASGSRPVAAYAMHVFTTGFANGVFTARSGPTMAASAALDVTIVGAGGHGSAPYRAKDPVPAACEIVTALQTMVTRGFDPFDPVVLTVGSFHAGTRRNIIPDTAQFEATIRTFSAPALARIKDSAVTLVRAIAAAHGMHAEVEINDLYPVTVNDDRESAFVERRVREAFGEQLFQPLRNPLTGAEDFSRVLQEVPGTMVFLGAAPPDADPEQVPNNHSPHAVFDDTLLADGAALYADLAANRLAEEAAQFATSTAPTHSSHAI